MGLIYMYMYILHFKTFFYWNEILHFDLNPMSSDVAPSTVIRILLPFFFFPPLSQLLSFSLLFMPQYSSLLFSKYKVRAI